MWAPFLTSSLGALRSLPASWRLLVRSPAEQDADAGRDHEQDRHFTQRIEAAERYQDAGDDVRRAEFLRNLRQIVLGKRGQGLAFAVAGDQAAIDDGEHQNRQQDESALHRGSFPPAASSSRSASTMVEGAIGVRIAWAALDRACDDNGLVISTK